MTIFTSKRTLLVLLVCLFIAASLFITWISQPKIEELPADTQSEILTNSEAETEEAGQKVKGKENTNSDAADLLLPTQPVAGHVKEPVTETNEDFFANYRLDRERVRGQQVELLQGVINDPNSDAAIRKEAQNKLIQISESIDQELQLEALIKAKGFTEAALFIQPDSATAILIKDGMAESDVTVVADIISRVTGHNLEDIVVIPK